MIMNLLLVGTVAVAAGVDLRSRRIPNALTLPTLLLALLLRGAMGWEPLAAGLLGAGLGIAIGMTLFALGTLGAGDGKLLGVVGACLGPYGLLVAVLGAGVAGGLLAVIELGRQGSLRTALGVLHVSALAWIGTGGRTRLTLASPGVVTIPYGVAIAAGAIAAVFLT
jgi:prepilin peptidase CpaA